MLRVALTMLRGDRAKYAGLLFGIAFTSFLVTFASSYFCGMMTRGFALITENRDTDVWVMDPAVASVEVTTDLPASALDRVRGVTGVALARPLVLADAELRFPDGRFQAVQVIGIDDATLGGMPRLEGGLTPVVLRAPDAVIVDAGGTRNKLRTPRFASDRWPLEGPHLDAPTRPVQVGDELAVSDRRVRVTARSLALPRFPPRPLLYTSIANAMRILPPTRERLTFVLASAAPGLSPSALALRIERATGLEARASDDFAADTVRWSLANSEDVGDIAAMLTLALSVGLGVTGVMLYMFTVESRWQYAVLGALGAEPRLLSIMIFAQIGGCALLGTGLGLGLCSGASALAGAAGYPFRMMWFTPLVGAAAVLLVGAVAALISARPVRALDPAVVFST